MALAATGVLEIRTGGSDNNAGYFNAAGSSPGTDYSLQNAAHVTIDGVTITGIVHTSANQVNILGATVDATWNRNGLRVTGGTATAGLYEITAVDIPNNRISLDRNVGTTAQTIVGAIGGALATPGGAAALFTTSGMIGYVKSGTYTLTNTTQNTSGGPVLLTNNHQIWIGYQTTRGDMLGRPSIDAGSQTSITLFTSGSSSANQYIINMQFDGNSQTGVSGLTMTGNRHAAIYCKAIDCDQASAIGFTCATGRVWACKSENCTTGFTTPNATLCEAEGGATGFTGSSVTMNNCLAYDQSTNGFNITNNGTFVVNCTAKGSGGDGFVFAGSGTGAFNCLATDCGGFGFNGQSTSTILVNCAGRNNTSGNYDTQIFGNVNFIALSADPYVDSSTDDYRPNTTSGGGAAIRAASIGFLDQTNNLDIGAVQHSDAAGGGGQHSSTFVG